MKRITFFSLRYRLLLLVLIAVLPSLWLIIHIASEKSPPATEKSQKNLPPLAPSTSSGQEPPLSVGQNLIGLWLVTAFALGAAWFGGNFFILQRLRVVINAARRLESGDLTARTGLRYGNGEIGQLAHAFDRMASSLEQRNREREKTESEQKTLNEQLEQRVAQRTAELMEKNKQFEDDLELAQEFQVGLLPVRHPFFPLPGADGQAQAIRFAHCYEASGGVGGDYFSILPISPGATGLFVCDVMGHGVRAALVTAIIRGLVEEMKPVAHLPHVLLGHMNMGLVDVLKETQTTLFATAAYLVVDIQRGLLRYSNAGHPKPLHLRRRQGLVEPLEVPEEANGPAIGLFDNAEYAAIECKLQLGDAILSYTDGVFEVSNPQGEQYGEERLLAAVRRHSALPLEQIYPEVLAEIRAFAEGVKFEDDVCMVGFEWVTGAEAEEV